MYICGMASEKLTARAIFLIKREGQARGCFIQFSDTIKKGVIALMT